jgi:hypothetical protein
MAQQTVDLYGTVIGAAEVFNSPAGQDQEMTVNNLGHLREVNSLAPQAEIVRLGGTWQCAMKLASAFTHVATWPTTRSEFILYNGEPAWGKSYVIEQIWACNAATTIGAAGPYTLLGQIVVSSATALTDDATQLITSASGRGTVYTGRMQRQVVDAATWAVASKWQVLTAGYNQATASIGMGVVANLNGSWIMRPGNFLCLNAVIGTAAGTSIIGVVWDEVQLNLA